MHMHMNMQQNERKKTHTHKQNPTKTAAAAITKTSNKNTSNAAKESQGFGKFSKDSIRKHFGKVKAEIQLKCRNNNGRKCKTKPWNMFHYFVDLSHRPKETNPQISECNDLHLYIAHRTSHIMNAAPHTTIAMLCHAKSQVSTCTLHEPYKYTHTHTRHEMLASSS